MITKFNTSAAPAAVTGGGKGGNILLWILGLATVGYLGYKYVWPEIQKRRKENATTTK